MTILLSDIITPSSLATKTGTETLTNKTLSSPVLTGTVTAGGGVGTNGQVLQSTGSGVQWANAGGGSGTVSVSNYDTAGTISGTITGVTTLRFDNDTGIFVSDLGSGAVKVRLGSSFKTWKVTGQSDLVAVGEDTIQLIAGTGVSLTTDPSGSPYKTLTIAATGSGGTFTTSSSAPSTPSAGDRWLHSTTGVLYTYVDDGDSSQWVDLGDGGGSGGGGSTTDTLHPFLLMGA